MVAPAWSPNRLPRPHPIWKLCQGRFGDLAWLWSLSSGVRLAVQPQKDCGLSASLAAHVAFGTVCFPVRKVLARNSTAFPRASLLMGLPHQHSINPCTSRRSLQKFRLFYFFVFSPLCPFTPFHKTCQQWLCGMPACDGSKAKTTKLPACGQISLALLRGCSRGSPAARGSARPPAQPWGRGSPWGTQPLPALKQSACSALGT